MSDSEAKNRSLQALQIIQILLIAVVPMYWDISNRYATQLHIPMTDSDRHSFTSFLVVFGIFALIVGYFMPGFLLKNSKRSLGGKLVFIAFLGRTGLYESIAIFGLLLSIIGANWQYSVSLFVAAAAGLIFTFPTPTSWDKMVSLLPKTESSGQN